MSSHTNLPSPKPIPKPDHRTSQTKKPPSSSVSPQDQQTLKCPRCNSPNTKFCYYNNYSLSQPRHFCKSCRRYWTRGGALRNVPIGGGCRKTKKSIKPNSITPSSSSQRFFSSIMEDSSKYFPPPSTMDFQLAGLSLNKINDLQLFNNNQEVLALRTLEQETTQVDHVGSGLTLMGFGDYNNNNNNNYTTGAGGETTGNLATSIETLSCLNQDLHWRLQQQRMAMLFGNSKEETVVVERPQPILYRNLEIVSSSPSSPMKKGENQTEWYFGNNNDNEGVISNNGNTTGGGGSDQWNNGNIQAWTDLNHYNAMP
ncbi:hypothetical protein AALP_AA8G489000 [Arabis alpina]|uniref:Dof zinc finger protein n=1 Tax=Arabis alpina TaxID=50452 RepID=A0A087GEC6_ARAAL|nr:hypothetical protein AALP_AA8G489000 [Arabis alpina]